MMGVEGPGHTAHRRFRVADRNRLEDQFVVGAELSGALPTLGAQRVLSLWLILPSEILMNMTSASCVYSSLSWTFRLDMEEIVKK